MKTMREDAEYIISQAIGAVMPDAAVRAALKNTELGDGITVVAAGKAAWEMAKTAADFLRERIRSGIVITKYGHIKGQIPGFFCMEAGHPMPDKNSFAATQSAIEMVSGLQKNDTVLFLLSGGASALFEKALIPLEQLRDITAQLLACGADISEINTVRKRLSAVKGGRFAKLCAPAQVEAVILSDVLSDRVDMIASGPVSVDKSTAQMAISVAEKYHLRLSEQAKALLQTELPQDIDNVHAQIIGSVRLLCRAAADACEKLGYTPTILTDELTCEAKQAGKMLAEAALKAQESGKRTALIAGGETVVQLTGKGLGGRNQELALAAAKTIVGNDGICVFSVGSDGTDGPTDAAGGYADGNTEKTLHSLGIRIDAVLAENDSYHALEKTGGLIITGPTGTNVNDVAVALIRGE